jgi:hypothetical protein
VTAPPIPIAASRWSTQMQVICVSCDKLAVYILGWGGGIERVVGRKITAK